MKLIVAAVAFFCGYILGRKDEHEIAIEAIKKGIEEILNEGKK